MSDPKRIEAVSRTLVQEATKPGTLRLPFARLSKIEQREVLEDAARLLVAAYDALVAHDREEREANAVLPPGFSHKQDGRGFGVLTFDDATEVPCVIQEEQLRGQIDLSFEGYTSMSLDREGARSLASVLMHFAETGCLPGGAK